MNERRTLGIVGRDAVMNPPSEPGSGIHPAVTPSGAAAGAATGDAIDASSAVGGIGGHRLGIVAVSMANVFWSFGGVLGKSTGASGEVLSFWRMWVATAVMLVVAVAMRRVPTWPDIRRAAPLGALFGLNICAFFITLEYVSIAIALIVGALTPVVALPIAARFMGEQLSPTKIGCAIVAVGGVVLAVLAAPGGGADANTAIGYAWAVASLLVWVAYLLVSKRVREQVDTVQFMTVMSGAGAVMVSAIVVAVSADLGEVSGTDWWWVVMLAIGPGLIGHGLVAWAHPRVDSSVSSLLIQAEPVGASIAAWVFLDQRVSLVQGIAMVVVLVALGYLASREAREVNLALDEAVT